MHRLRLAACFAGAALLKPAFAMPAFDAFATESLVATPAMVSSSVEVGFCPAGMPPQPLTLHEAITRILCHDPTIRHARSTAQMRAAQVGQRQSTYLPRLDGRVGQSANHTATRFGDDLGSTSNNSRMRAGNLSFSWVLFDFGRREAALEASHQMLAAANSDQNATIQRAFLDAAHLYFAARASNQRLAAAQQVMDLAKDNYAAADEKYKAGAAALSDRLRAQTAYTQASLRVSRERGALSSALGSMALRMGLPALTAINIDERIVAFPALDFMSEVDELIRIARGQHPSLIAAQARAKAALAATQEARAMARPSIALTSNLGLSNSFGHGPNSQRQDMNIGLQLSIPLFSGLEQTYQIREAQAQAAAHVAELDTVRLRVSEDVLTQYNSLCTEKANLVHTSALVEQSKQAMDIVQGRYRSGVGSMTEVLNTMETYASVQEQHIGAMSNWQVSRVALAAHLGLLVFWGLD